MNKVVRIKKWLVKNEFLIIILSLTAVFRIPSLLEPYWYGDEAIYLTIGQAMRAGVKLYSGIHDNKPPLLYVMSALVGGNQFWFKFIALVWVGITIVVFYSLARKVFKKSWRSSLATIIFAFLISWPKLEGNIANAELFFLLPTLAAMYWLWNKPKTKTVFWAGVLLGLGGLFKMPAILEAGVWPVIWLFGKDKDWWKKTLILGAGVLLPLALSGVYYALAGSLRQYIDAAWAQNLPYLSSWKAPGGGGSGIFSLTGRAVVALAGVIGVLVFSTHGDRRFRIIGVWSAIALFASLLSGRPYPHYLVQALGVLAISSVFIVSGNKKEVLLGLIVLGCFWSATEVFKFYKYPVWGYYKNFGEWIFGRKGESQYFGWFNEQVNRNYQISQIIKSGSETSDKIFVWGDEPMVYALSRRLPVGRYTVKYHVKDFQAEKETMQALVENPPRYIVSFGKEDELPGLTQLIEQRYLVQERIEGATIMRLRSIFNDRYN